MLDRTRSFQDVGSDLDCQNDTERQAENPYEEYRRLVQEQTEAFSNMPGRVGRRLRIALACGWC